MNGMNKQIEVESMLIARWGKNRTNMDLYKVVKKTDLVVWIQKLCELKLVECSDQPAFRDLEITETKVLDSDEPVFQCSYSGGEVQIMAGVYAYLWEGNLELLLQSS